MVAQSVTAANTMTSQRKLSQGLSYLAIPGPSVIPDAVLNAMHRPAPNIYAGELVDMMPGLVDGLNRVARTRPHVAMYILSLIHLLRCRRIARCVARGVRCPTKTTK